VRTACFSVEGVLGLGRVGGTVQCFSDTLLRRFELEVVATPPQGSVELASNLIVEKRPPLRIIRVELATLEWFAGGGREETGDGF